MKLIKTPSGEIFKYSDCKIFDDIFDVAVFFDIENQEALAEELFEKTGILIADKKGGEIII